MSLKLFRSTEFANSSLFSPAVQRIAIHPFWVALLASAWLATAGNLALWQELMKQPGWGNVQGLWLGLRLAVLIVAVLCAILSLASWRWTFKPAITILLFLAAFASHVMLTRGIVIDTDTMVQALQTKPGEIRTLLSWQLFLIVMVLAVLPSVWLWRTPVRRIPPFQNLLQSALFLMVSCAVIAGTLSVSFQDFSPLMNSQTPLRYLFNPFNSLYALADIVTR